MHCIMAQGFLGMYQLLLMVGLELLHLFKTHSWLFAMLLFHSCLLHGDYVLIYLRRILILMKRGTRYEAHHSYFNFVHGDYIWLLYRRFIYIQTLAYVTR